MRQRIDLFLVSFLVLFLELACIRWFPAHVLFLTFFTNTVLLACVPRHVGGLPGRRIAAGTTCSGRRSLLVLALGSGAPGRMGAPALGQHRRRRQPGVAADGVLRRRVPAARSVDVSSIPIEVLSRLLLPGDRAGHGRARASSWAAALARLPNRLEAYTIEHPRQHRRHRCCSRRARGSSSPPLWWFGDRHAGFGVFPDARDDRLRGFALALAPRRRVPGVRSGTPLHAAAGEPAGDLVAVLPHRLPARTRRSSPST